VVLRLAQGPTKSKGIEVAETVVETTPAGEDPSRRDFIHVAAMAAAVGAVGSIAWPLINQMNPSGDMLAMASLEFDLSKVADGSEVTIKWRGKPVFIRKRTPAEIARAVKDDQADLKDPAKDADRHKPGKAEWLILIGSCTHLGCVPTFGGGDWGGWFCPCHGSHYDTAGRIRKGPAPTNLALPDYAFLSDTKVKIG
jgi:ubiquinol-cytochrome c reductase iron-sulfur subunit